MNLQKIKNHLFPKGFTLVELIVVITILAILGTIGFLSIQGYSSSARDSTRVSNLVSLQKWLGLWRVVSGTFPMPENALTLTASGTVIGYQGFAKEQIASMAKLSPGTTKDPLDPGMFTTYAVNANQTKMQLMVFLEDGGKVTGLNMIPWVYEAVASAGTNYTARSPMLRGDTVGILLGSTGSSLNQPVQELVTGSFTGVDLAKTTSGSGYTMVFALGDSTATVPTSGTGAYTGSLFTYAYNKRDDLIGDKALASSDSSLVGYWDMETVCSGGSCGGGNDGKLRDLSGYGNNGVCYNGTSSWTCGSVGPQIVEGNGKNGKVMSFDGVDDYVQSPINMQWSSSFTLVMKLKPVQLAHQQNYFSLWQGGNGSVLYIPNNKFAYWNGSTPTQMNLLSNVPIEPRYFLTTGSFDGTTMKISIDGILKWTAQQSNFTLAWNNVMMSNPWVWFQFEGTIDETRVYNRILSDSEISILYNATK